MLFAFCSHMVVLFSGQKEDLILVILYVTGYMCVIGFYLCLITRLGFLGVTSAWLFCG